MYTVTHERIFATNGKLNYVDIKSTGAYKVSATDVRSFKFKKDEVTFRLVWEKGAKVSDLVKKYGADYGINAPFFWNGTPIADCIADGKLLNQGYDNPNGAKQTIWHGLAYKNKELKLGLFNINDGWDFLIKTTPYLLSTGNPCWDWFRALEGTAPDIGLDANGNYVRAQRTFIGIDANGDVIIAASDGRTTTDRGLTLEEMSLYMKDKGAVDALNFDGGSSTVLADQSGMLNDQGTAGEKAVNHAFLVFVNKTPVTPQKDWKQEGFDYLVQNYGVDPMQWTKDSPLDIGTLGSILKRK